WLIHKIYKQYSARIAEVLGHLRYKSAHLISSLLVTIINESLAHGIIFSKLKHSKKKGVEHSLGNYCPILLVSSFSKIFESALDDKYEFVDIFYDIAKAFDSINQDILLLGKFEYMEIRGTAYNWLKSLLANRYQIVHIQYTVKSM
ncbi:hypothetical protein J437_LFUL002454, partial [Ladona fulva]